MSRSYERVPIEVWKYILDAVIDNTLLLSTNPFEFDWQPSLVLEDWNNDATSYCNNLTELSERHTGCSAKCQFRCVWNTLRLVCHSWKQFADSPAVKNRHLQLDLRVSIEASRMEDILLAKRLRILSFSKFLIEFCGSLEGAIEGGAVFNSEIILDTGGWFTNQIIGTHPSSFPYLTTLSLEPSDDAQTTIPPEKLNQVLRSLPSLRHFLFQSDDQYEFSKDGILQLPNLRTLSISSGNPLQDLHLSEWKLPSLTHLRLWGLPLRTSDSSPYGLVDYLQAHGKSLLYLSIKIQSSPEVLPPYFQIWLDCPKVRHLEVPFSFLFAGGHFVVPPKRHPVERLVNTLDREISYGVQVPVNGFLGHFARFCLAARSLRCITESHLWVHALTHVEPVSGGAESDEQISPMAVSSQLTYILAHKIEAYGIRFEDKIGLSLKEGRELWAQTQTKRKLPVNDPPVLLL
ncbi:hypothetical protein FRC18_012040, partial [Serendipita sp. 400]